MFDASPYLAALAAADPDLVASLQQTGPDAVCDRALAALARLPQATPRPALMQALRRAKKHVALATAVADLSNEWSLEQVTGALSDLAEGALRAAVGHVLHEAHAAGALTLPHPGSPARGSGFVVLAMGKLGARELNYSSDIDLLLLHDPAEAADPEQAATFARLAHALTALLAAPTEDGYVFRVDLRLRPDPASTPPVMALPAALTYYESRAQTWERAALIKARPVAGDTALGRRFLTALTPVVWRRYLDFAAIADMRAMKQRIDRHRGEAPALAGRDLKLEPGGIREIEFCAQALQLAWGGREPAVRLPGTLAALTALADAGHLPADDARALADAYRFLRRMEHRVQMQHDRQTHRLPDTDAALAAFAAFAGLSTTAALADAVARHTARVRRVFEATLPEPAGAATAGAPAWPGPGEPPWEAWLAGKPRALRTERGRALLRVLLPALLAAVRRQQEPETALRRLDEFLHRLPSGVAFLSTLRHAPVLLERLADVLGAAPWLADHLASQPAALDGLLQADSEDAAPSVAARCREAASLEAAVAGIGPLVRAAEFRLAAAELAGSLTPDATGYARAALAEAAIAGLLPLAMHAIQPRHGRVPGGGLAVVALGRLGSREMLAGSDLDMLLIYDHPAGAQSRGTRPLPAPHYFARVAQALVTALAAPTRDGPLYPVDMRLRPSGRAGPVAVALPAFAAYHARDAWTWERLALTRARVVAGPPSLRRRVAAALDTALAGGDPAHVRPDTAAMRARLARDLPPHGAYDVKLRPGGLMEAELLIQALTLLHPVGRGLPAAAAAEALAAAGALPAEEAADLAGAVRTWHAVQGMSRIMLGRAIPAHPAGTVLTKLRQAAGLPGDGDEPALCARLDLLAGEVRRMFTRHLGEIEPA